MAPYISFVNSNTDYELYKKYYNDSEYVRISLENKNSFYKNISGKLWVDPAIDGFYNALKGNSWSAWDNYIESYDNYQLLRDEEFVETPDQNKVFEFVFSVLDACMEYSPKMITVPQFPAVDGASYNSINRYLSKAAKDWKTERDFNGEFVLPLVFTHQNQLKGKSVWRTKIKLAKKCKEISGASFIWAVDSSLSDQCGSDSLNKRFKKLVEFHEDIKKAMPESRFIAGPYWGMNLVLWSKNLCDYPAVSLGSGYQYRISGGFRGARAKKRIALPPLRRWAVAHKELRDWIEKAMKQLSPNEDSYQEFEGIKDKFDMFTQDIARDQIAKFYKSWIDRIANAPSNGRAFVLYQDLSMAYVLGKRLMNLSNSKEVAELPKTEAPGRDPSKVAQQFMLQCL